MNLFSKILSYFAIRMHFGLVARSLDAVLLILPFSIITLHVLFTSFVTFIVGFDVDTYFFSFKPGFFLNEYLTFIFCGLVSDLIIKIIF